MPTAALARPAVEALPARQAGWIVAQVLAAVLLALVDAWREWPHLALGLSLAAGASAVHPRRVWALPLVGAAVVLAVLIFDALRWPAVLGAGAVAGALAARLLPEPTDALDLVNAALGTAIGATVGLWASVQLLPPDLGGTVGVGLSAALVGLVASQGLVPLSLRLDRPRLPSGRAVRRALRVPYRTVVFKAFALYRSAMRRPADADTRAGLCEVATWVFRLQQTLQALDDQLDELDPDEITARIAACEAETGGDAFTRDRRRATAAHLRRLLAHRSALTVEREHADAVVGYALAFLEEARVGLTVAWHLPGESAPERLPEVLDRLRQQAAAGQARRRTERELGVGPG